MSCKIVFNGSSGEEWPLRLEVDESFDELSEELQVQQRALTTKIGTCGRQGSAHTDENVKGWCEDFFRAWVTPNEKSRRLGTAEPAAHRLPL